MAFNSTLAMSTAQTSSCLKLVKPLWLNESKGKNFAFSPLSINTGLSLIASGSNGRTLEQMLSFLNCETLSHLNSNSSKLIDSLDRRQIDRGGAPNQLTFKSGLWVERSSILKPSFEEIASSIYRTEVEAVDFKNKAEDVPDMVNKWIEKETNGLIQDMLPHGSTNELTRLVYANALYFRGLWKNKFNPSQTENSEFHLLDGSSVQAPFMTNSEYQIVYSYEGFKVLRLLYKQEATDNDHDLEIVHSKSPNMFDRFQNYLSMYIFLPDKHDGLGDLIEKMSLDSDFLDRHLPIHEPAIRLRNFRIPKFNISFGFEGSRALKDLGLVLPFDSKEAELTEMVSNNENERIYVSGLYHNCVVKVDESGTEAAASTGLLSVSSALPCPPYVDFVADHPFVFMIRDDNSGAVWFLGHVVNPSLTY